MNRAEALAIVDEFVKNPNLKKHMLAVEAAMRAYSQKYGGLPEEWGIVGLLHDFDWEIHPTIEEHPARGEAILKDRGLPDHLRRAILAHAKHTGIPRETQLEKAAFACDEITGLIVAVALVTPSRKLSDVTPERVIKKMKEKSFAANVNRDEIREGAELLGLPLEEHVQNVLTAMQSIHAELGL